MDSFVRFSKEGRVAVVRLDRPPVNALTPGMIADLGGIVDRVASDDEIAVMVITGGKVFAAGADIREMSGLDRDSGRALARSGHEVLGRLERLGQPVLCAIEGACLGGGCEIALACDVRIAGEGARVGLPEVALGAIPGWGGTQRLPRQVGLSGALLMMLTGEPVDAQEALRLGLVDRVTPAGEALGAAMETAARIASFGQAAVRAVKRVAKAGAGATGEAGFEAEEEAFGDLCGTEDMREGLKAFLEKRRAVFRDR